MLKRCQIVANSTPLTFNLRLKPEVWYFLLVLVEGWGGGGVLKSKVYETKPQTLI